MGKLQELTTFTQKVKDKKASKADRLIIPTYLHQTSRPHAINDSHRGVCYEPDTSTSKPVDDVPQIVNATSTQTPCPVAVHGASSLLHQSAPSLTVGVSGVTSSPQLTSLPANCQVSSIPPSQNSPKPKVADARTPQHNCFESHKVVQTVLQQLFNKPGYVVSPSAGVHSPPSVQENSTSAHTQMSSLRQERTPLSQAQPVPLSKSIQVSVSPSVRSSVTDMQKGTRSCLVRSSESVESGQTPSCPGEKSLERMENMEQSMTKQQETEAPAQFCSNVEALGLNCVHSAKSVLTCKSDEKAKCDSLPGTRRDDGHVEHLNSSTLLDTTKLKLKAVSGEECPAQTEMTIANDGENRQKKKYGKRIFPSGTGAEIRSGMKGGWDVYGKETMLLEDEDRRRQRSLPILRVCLKRLDPTKFNVEVPVVQKRKVGRPKGTAKKVGRPKGTAKKVGRPKGTTKKVSSVVSPCSSIEDTSEVSGVKKALYEHLVKRGLLRSSESSGAEKSSLFQDKSVIPSEAKGTVDGKSNGLSAGAKYAAVLQGAGFGDFNMETNSKNKSQEDRGGEMTADMPMDSASSRTLEAVSNKCLLGNVADSCTCYRECENKTSQQFAVTERFEEKKGEKVNAVQESSSWVEGGENNNIGVPASQEIAPCKPKCPGLTGCDRVTDTANTGQAKKTSEKLSESETHLFDLLDKRRKTQEEERGKGQQDRQHKSKGVISFLAKSVENKCGHLPKSTVASSEGHVNAKVNHFEKNSPGSKNIVLESSSTEDLRKVIICQKKNGIVVEDGKKAKLPLRKPRHSCLNPNIGPGRKKRCCSNLFKTSHQSHSLDTESRRKKQQGDGFETSNEEENALEIRGENTLKKGRPRGMRTSNTELRGDTSGGDSCKGIPQPGTRPYLAQCSEDKEMAEELSETGLKPVDSGRRKPEGRRKGSKRFRDDVKQVLQEDKDALLLKGQSLARLKVEDDGVGQKLMCCSSDTLSEGCKMVKKKKSNSEPDVVRVGLTKSPYKKRRTDPVKPNLSSDTARRKRRPYKKRITEVMKLQLSADEERSLNKRWPFMKRIENRKRDIVEGDMSREEQPVAKKLRYEDSDTFTAEGKKRLMERVSRNSHVKENSLYTQEKGRFLKNNEQVVFMVEGNVVRKKRGRPPKHKPQEQELSVVKRKGVQDEQCSDDVSSGSGEAKVSVSSRNRASIIEGNGKPKAELEDLDVTEVKKREPYKKKKGKNQVWSPQKDKRPGKKVQLCKKNLENLPSTSCGRLYITKQSAPYKQYAEDKKLLRGYLSQAAVKRYSCKQNKMNCHYRQGVQLRKPRGEAKVQPEPQKQNEDENKLSSATFLSIKKKVKPSENSESIALRLLNQRRSVSNQTLAKPKQKKTMTAKWERYLDRLKRAAALRRSAIGSPAGAEQWKEGGPLKKAGQEETVGSDVKTEGSYVNRKSVKGEASSIKQLYKSSTTSKGTKLSSVKSANGNVVDRQAKTQKELIKNREKAKKWKQLIENRLRSMREGRERKMEKQEKRKLRMLRLLKQRRDAGALGRKKMPKSSMKSKSERKHEFTKIKRQQRRSKHIVTKTKPEEKAKKLRSEKSSTHLKAGKRKASSEPPVIEIERDPAYDAGEFSSPDPLAPEGQRVRKTRLFPVPGSPWFYQLRSLNTCDLSHSCCQKAKATMVDVSTQWEDPLPLYSALMYRDMFSLARRDSAAKLEPGEDWTLDQESLIGSLMNLARQENSYLTLGQSASRADQQSPNVPPSLSSEPWGNSPPILQQSSGAVLSASLSLQTPLCQETDSLMNAATPHSVHVQMNDSCSSFTVTKAEPHGQRCRETSSNNALWSQEWEYLSETNGVDSQMLEVNAEERLQEDSGQDMSCPVIFSVGSVSEEDFSKASLVDADSLCGGESRNLLGISPCNDVTGLCDSSSGDVCADGDDSQNCFTKGHAPRFRYDDSQERPQLQGQGMSPNRNPLNMKKRNEETEDGTHFTICNASSVNEKPDENSLDTASVSTSSFVVISDDSEGLQRYNANTCASSQYVENASVVEKLKNCVRDKPQPNHTGKGMSGGGRMVRARNRQEEDPRTSASLSSCDPPSCDNQLLEGLPSGHYPEHYNDPFKNVKIYVHDNGQIADHPNEDVS